MAEGFRNKVLGDEENQVKKAFTRLKRIEEILKGVWTAEPVVVTDYHFSDQEVDVKLINYPDSYRKIKNIPIYNTSGGLQVIQRFGETPNANKIGSDVGILLFTRTDSKNSFHDKTLNESHPPVYHEGSSGIFIPGPITTDEDPPDILDPFATSTDLDDLGPQDSALVHESGSHILFKENGEVVIKGKEIFFGSDQDSVTSFKTVARDGDTVNNPNTENGTIEASTVTIKAGD